MLLTVKDACTKLGIDYMNAQYKMKEFLNKGMFNGKKLYVGKRMYWVVETDDELFEKNGPKLVTIYKHSILHGFSEMTKKAIEEHVKEDLEDLKRRIREGYQYTWKLGKGVYVYTEEV